MRTRPVDTPTAGATAKTGRGRQHVGWRNLGHLLPHNINDFTVTFTATRILQGRLRPQIKAAKDLHQLVLEIICSNEHRPRTDGRQFPVLGEQPSVLVAGTLLEYSILRPRLEKGAVETEEPQPPC